MVDQQKLHHSLPVCTVGSNILPSLTTRPSLSSSLRYTWLSARRRGSNQTAFFLVQREEKGAPPPQRERKKKKAKQSFKSLLHIRIFHNARDFHDVFSPCFFSNFRVCLYLHSTQHGHCTGSLGLQDRHNIHFITHKQVHEQQASKPCDDPLTLYMYQCYRYFGTSKPCQLNTADAHNTERFTIITTAFPDSHSTEEGSLRMRLIIISVETPLTMSLA